MRHQNISSRIVDYTGRKFIIAGLITLMRHQNTSVTMLDCTGRKFTNFDSRKSYSDLL